MSNNLDLGLSQVAEFSTIEEQIARNRLDGLPFPEGLEDLYVLDVAQNAISASLSTQEVDRTLQERTISERSNGANLAILGTGGLGTAVGHNVSDELMIGLASFESFLSIQDDGSSNASNTPRSETSLDSLATPRSVESTDAAKGEFEVVLSTTSEGSTNSSDSKLTGSVDSNTTLGDLTPRSLAAGSELASPTKEESTEDAFLSSPVSTPTNIGNAVSSPVTNQPVAKAAFPNVNIKTIEFLPYAYEPRIVRWYKQELNKPLTPAVHFEEYYQWNATKTKKFPSPKASGYPSEQHFHNHMIMLHSLPKELDRFSLMGVTEKTQKLSLDPSRKNQSPTTAPVTICILPMEIKDKNGGVLHVGALEWNIDERMKTCYHRYFHEYSNKKHLNTPNERFLPYMDANYFKGRRSLPPSANLIASGNVVIDQDLGTVRIQDPRLGVEVVAYAKV